MIIVTQTKGIVFYSIIINLDLRYYLWISSHDSLGSKQGYIPTNAYLLLSPRINHLVALDEERSLADDTATASPLVGCIGC